MGYFGQVDRSGVLREMAEDKMFEAEDCQHPDLDVTEGVTNCWAFCHACRQTLPYAQCGQSCRHRAGVCPRCQWSWNPRNGTPNPDLHRCGLPLPAKAKVPDMETREWVNKTFPPEGDLDLP